MEGFLDDVDKIEGWDLNLYFRGKLQLDKDIKIKGNKLYSRDTCMWVSPEDNAKTKPSYQIPFYAYNIWTEVLYQETSLTDFGKFAGVKEPALSKGIKNNRHHRVGDWLVWYTSDPVPSIEYYTMIALDTKESYSSYSALEVERHFEIGSGAFNKYKNRGLDSRNIVKNHKMIITTITPDIAKAERR